MRQIGENPAMRLRLVEGICGGHDLSFRSVFGAPPKKHALMPLQEYFREHFWPARTQGEPNLPPVASSTARAEEGFWRKINAGIGHVRLADLDPWVWETYVAEMPQHPRTKALHRAAYKALLDYAHLGAHQKPASRAHQKPATVTIAIAAISLNNVRRGALGPRTTTFGERGAMQAGSPRGSGDRAGAETE